MNNYLPVALTTMRLLLGPVALLCASAGVARFVYLPILIVGTLSDVFDGILARRFGVSTDRLRRYDSVTDVIYYLFLLGAAWILCKPVILRSLRPIGAILLSEAAVLLVSLGRFRRYPATHSYLAKFYGLCLLAALIAMLVFNASNWAVIGLSVVAVITNIEIIAIHFLVDSPPVDVRSVFAVQKRGA